MAFHVAFRVFEELGVCAGAKDIMIERFPAVPRNDNLKKYVATCCEDQ
jgi:hypothetical protein